jgi:DNA-binding winged helix-turn-helix (wHTH) protein
MSLRFGDCFFDRDTRQVSRDGRALALSPKAFQLLQVLLERRPRALSQAELHELIWPGTFVSPTSLPRLVSEIRKAIGDDPSDPHFVRTVHGYGYAFSGPVEGEGAFTEPAPGRPAACHLVLAGQEVPLAEGENLIGRGVDCAVRILSPRVSRRHARLVVTEGSATLEDLGSKNGTYLRGRRLDAVAPLVDGDEIAMGTALLIFRGPVAFESTQTTSRQ